MVEQPITHEQGRAEVAEELAKKEKNKAMQEQESTQVSTHYYRTIFTLKSGGLIEICHKETYEKVLELKFVNGVKVVKIEGFIKNPLLVGKTIKVVLEEIAAIEIVKDPCTAQLIPWPEEIYTETPIVPDIPVLSSGLDDGVNVSCNKHDENCAMFKNPRRTVLIDESKCDCGYVVLTGNEILK